MNNTVQPSFKEKFAEIRTCESFEQQTGPTQKKHGTAQTQTRLYPNPHYKLFQHLTMLGPN